jgi:transcriptional regulator with XRE-family HTH domain
LLRQLRTEARLTQEELAERAGLSPRSVSDLERGINRTARKDSALMLASALKLTGPAQEAFVAAARTLPSGRTLTVPTAEETLRIKGFLIVRRNQTRDYLDVAALADRYGLEKAAPVLARIDDYYADQHGAGSGVAFPGNCKVVVTRNLPEPGRSSPVTHRKPGTARRRADAPGSSRER